MLLSTRSCRIISSAQCQPAPDIEAERIRRIGSDPAFLHLYGQAINGLCSQFERDRRGPPMSFYAEETRCCELSERAYRVAFRAWELLRVGRWEFCEPYSEREARIFNSRIVETEPESDSQAS